MLILAACSLSTCHAQPGDRRRAVFSRTRRRSELGSKSRRRGGCQRLGLLGHRGTNKPTLAIQSREAMISRSSCPIPRPAEAVSDVVKTSGPPVKSLEAQVFGRHPRGESRGRPPGTREVRVHAIRTGGRGRLDASRVFCAGRSKGLVEQEGASREEARSTA
jgi:hypothetical protein